MKLTKRETMLVTLLLALLASVGVYTFVLSPLNTQAEALEAQYEELSAQKLDMEILLAQPTITSNYEKQKEKAKEHYDSFYSTLNTYTIDNILSSLMDEQGLHVMTMKISPYLPVETTEHNDTVTDTDLLTREETNSESKGEEEQENLLLKCTVELEGGGKFEGIMNFLNAMNDKSFCVSAQSLNIQYRTDTNLSEYEAQFSCSIDIYGIATPEGITLV